MATRTELVELAVRALNNNPPKDFSVADLEGSFREELKKLGGTRELYRRNKIDIFELMEMVFNEVLPKRVAARYGEFAEFVQVPHGAKAVFKRKLGRMRAKSFITKVGLDGVFETFRLDQDSFEISTEAIGGAAVMSWERYLAGQDDLAECLEIILEGFDDYIYKMIAEAINASANAVGRPANTVASASDFDEAKVKGLISTVRAYGEPIIVCTPAFADTIPGNYVLANSRSMGRVAGEDASDIREFGYVKMYHGCPVMVIPNSFVDESNSEKVLSDQYAYIVPGETRKLATVVLEGGVQIDEFKNKDRTHEISAYQKVGVGILHTNFWAIYQNTSL